MRLTSFIVLISVFVSGCNQTTQNSAVQPNGRIWVTLNSDPQGAKIYDGSKFMGTTPTTVSYFVSDNSFKQGHVKTTPLRFVWISGAERKIILNLSIDKSTRQNYEAIRDRNYPNFSLDYYEGEKRLAQTKPQNSTSNSNSDDTGMNGCLVANAALMMMCSGMQGTAAMQCQTRMIENMNKDCR